MVDRDVREIRATSSMKSTSNVSADGWAMATASLTALTAQRGRDHFTVRTRRAYLASAD
jgi:hypothetical protein